METFSDGQYNQKAIEACIATKWLGRRLFFYESVGSTNEQAHLLAKAGKTEGAGFGRAAGLHGIVVVSDRQTAGKGRRGRAWDSPAGTNIYFSVLLQPNFAPDKASMLTLLMAYAVREAVEGQLSAILPFPCAIKWPNDIVINGKKVCGILTELFLEEAAAYHVVIGVGINVGKQDFAPELAEKAASLEAECGQVISRSRLLADILQVFEREYEAFAVQNAAGSLQKFKDRYNACLVNMNREVCVLDPKGEYRGVARGINDAGELMVELADGTISEVYAGEVSVRGVYGYV